MSDNLPKRLRDAADKAELNWPEVYCVPEDLAREAAGEIERLNAEIARLREALTKFAEHFGPLEDNELLHPMARECFALARAALAKEEKK